MIAMNYNVIVNSRKLRKQSMISITRYRYDKILIQKKICSVFHSQETRLTKSGVCLYHHYLGPNFSSNFNFRHLCK